MFLLCRSAAAISLKAPKMFQTSTKTPFTDLALEFEKNIVEKGFLKKNMWRYDDGIL